jgi:hypothetical protein
VANVVAGVVVDSDPAESLCEVRVMSILEMVIIVLVVAGAITFFMRRA